MVPKPGEAGVIPPKPSKTAELFRVLGLRVFGLALRAKTKGNNADFDKAPDLKNDGLQHLKLYDKSSG